MKKLLTGVLATLTCFTCAAAVACGDDNKGNQVKPLDAAKDTLYAMYIDHSSAETINDYEVVNSLAVGDHDFTVTWTVNVTEGVAITEGSDEYTWTVDVTPGATAIEYVLTATITDAKGKTATVSFDRVVSAVSDPYESRIVTSPAVDTEYLMYMYQGNTQEAYFLKGGINNHYLDTSTKTTEAIVIKLEETTGGFYAYYMDGATKLYLNMVQSGNYTNGVYGETATSVYTFNTEYNTLIGTVNSKNFFFGTRGDKTYTTMGPCEDKYLAENFVAHLIVRQSGEGVDPSVTPDPDPNPDPSEIQTLTIPEAITLGSAQDRGSEDSAYTTEKYYVIGEVKSITNTKYGNMYIKDADGNEILVYGTYDSTGTNGGEKMENFPKVGDTVKLLSVVGNYRGTPQLLDAWIMEITPATAEKKIEIEKNALNVAETFTGAGTLTLATAGKTYTDVVITWAVTAGSDIATYENGVLTIANPTADTTVTLKATLTLGETSQEFTYNIAISAKVAGQETTSYADFDTLTKNTGYGERTTTSGWVAVNAAVYVGGSADTSGEFAAIVDGDGNNTTAVTLNGKTSAVGKLTSCELSGGIKKLSFNFGHFNSEGKPVNITINIKNASGEVVATKTLEQTVTKLESNSFEWVLDTAVEGTFVIEIVNNCPAGSSSNKDRVSIWNLAWVS